MVACVVTVILYIVIEVAGGKVNDITLAMLELGVVVYSQHWNRHEKLLIVAGIFGVLYSLFSFHRF